MPHTHGSPLTAYHVDGGQGRLRVTSHRCFTIMSAAPFSLLLLLFLFVASVDSGSGDGGEHCCDRIPIHETYNMYILPTHTAHTNVHVLHIIMVLQHCCIYYNTLYVERTHLCYYRCVYTAPSRLCCIVYSVTSFSGKFNI